MLPQGSVFAAGLILASIPLDAATPPTGNLMPVPAHVAFGADRCLVDGTFTTVTVHPASPRLLAAIQRLRKAWGGRGALAGGNHFGPAVTLTIDCPASGPAYPDLGTDESYTLTVTPSAAKLTAATEFGALHGLATLVELLEQADGHSFLPTVTITDAPRFPWRGLMIDVARRWQSIEVIERNLDAMELVKLNVLHLHLTDDQGFRIESRTHPELTALGSDHLYFTQAQMREIIAYAAARGIRVVPEFDVPGHATSWVVSHPELASLPGPYQIERQWGVFDPVLDPTNEATYALLADFLGEMADLFPDPFLHIGGDENNGVQWKANPRIRAYIQAHGLKDDAGLHAYFNGRVAAILAQHGKRIVGWDEILNPNLPKDSVIDSWRGSEALGETAKLGFSGILSNGFYIDLVYHAEDHYLNEPFPAGSTLTAEEQKCILGGEATMWAEWVSPETIDSRIWPRTAAVAERLWSPATQRDVPDMYRRLAVTSTRLTEGGTQQRSNATVMLSHFAGPNLPADDRSALQTLIALVEPVKHYQRGGIQIWQNQRMPLVGLADAAQPDSLASRAFSEEVRSFLFAEKADRRVAGLETTLKAWSAAADRVLALGAKDAYPALREAKDPAAAIILAARVGVQALDAIAAHTAPTPAETTQAFADLDQASSKSLSATELPFLPAVRLLVAAAAEQSSQTAPGWQSRVEALARSKSAP